MLVRVAVVALAVVVVVVVVLAVAVESSYFIVLNVITFFFAVACICHFKIPS